MKTPDSARPSQEDGRNRRSRASRAALLEAGRTIFLDRGFRAASVSQIAAAAGVAHGTFYTHFTGKDALLEHLLDDLTAAFAAILEVPAPPTRSQDNRAIVQEQFRRFLALAVAWRPLLQVYREALAEAPPIQRHWDQVIGQITRRAAGDLRRSQRLGIAKADFDPELTAEALVRMGEHFLWETVRGRLDVADIGRVAETCTRIYMEGVYHP